MNAMTRPTEAQIIKAARALYHKDGEIEIDDHPIVSSGGDRGSYVAAWVWIYDTDAEMNKP